MDETAVATTDHEGLAERGEGRGRRVKAVVLQDLAEVERFAELIYKSSLVPKEYRNNKGDVIGIIMFGLEVGLHPMQALQNIAFVGSRPSVYGDMMLALVEASGLLEWFQESAPHEALAVGAGRCTVTRRGRPAITRTFTVAEAKTARLWMKSGPWTDYPGRMLQMRARSWALRDAFPDVLKGLMAREEAQDIIDVTPTSDARPGTQTPQDVLTGAGDAHKDLDQPPATPFGEQSTPTPDEVIRAIIATLEHAYPYTGARQGAYREFIPAQAMAVVKEIFGVERVSKLKYLAIDQLTEGYETLLDHVELVPPGAAIETVDAAPQHQDDDDVPLTSGPEQPQAPQDETTDRTEGVDSPPEPWLLTEASSVVGDDPDLAIIESDDYPDVEVDEDGFVTQPGVAWLRKRAVRKGQTALLGKILGESPGWPLGQWRYAWIEVGRQAAKVS